MFSIYPWKSETHHPCSDKPEWLYWVEREFPEHNFEFYFHSVAKNYVLGVRPEPGLIGDVVILGPKPLFGRAERATLELALRPLPGEVLTPKKASQITSAANDRELNILQEAQEDLTSLHYDVGRM